ncbi:MAG: DNA polymerase I [Negativicutes bacterium]|jgi:DNA polymerase-1
MKKLVLIDGSSLVHRAFYALPPMVTATGLHTNAVFGLASMLIKLLTETRPDYVVAAFDKSRITFRTDIFSDYKAHRKETPAELCSQFPLTHELLETMGIPVIELAGFEADDIIGTLAKKAENNDIETIIVTGDRDALQLVDNNTSAWLTKKGISEVQKIDITNIEQLFGVDARGVIELKALMGDSSDNIPGVPGVGEKTALKLLQEFGDLDGVYNNIDSLKGKLHERLADNKELAYLSKQLATIDTGIVIEQSFDDLKSTPDLQALEKFCDRLAFKSIKYKLLEFCKIGETAVTQQPPELIKVEYTLDSVDNRIDSILKSGRIAVYYQFSGKSPTYICEQLAVALENEVVLFSGRQECKRLIDTVAGKIDIATFDFKTMINVCANIQLASGLVDDVQLLAYVIEPSDGKMTLKRLTEQFLPERSYDWAGTGSEALAIAARCVYELLPIIKEAAGCRSVYKLYSELELPLSPVLAAMERCGICVDLLASAKLEQEFAMRLESLTSEIYRLAGIDFNINSPKQLGEVLFERLKLPTAKKNKTGYSTDVEVLLGLQAFHPVIELILEYRMLAKLNSTYLEAFKNLADPETGRIHTTFNQTVTATGRLSSSEPNLQNIPVKTEIGRKIRRLFVPGAGFDYLLSADYSQIELRILAHLSGDKTLIAAFKNNEDIHTITASEIFNIPLEAVTAMERSRAKAVNFGIVYGLSDYGLSKNIGVSRKVAASYIEQYFSRYPAVKQYIEKNIRDARQTGYAETIFGRKRTLPDINSSNYNLRSFAERTAMNTPVQGAAADIIKMAMLAVAKELRVRNLRSRMLLQVHDELVLEVIEDERFEVELIVQTLMENAACLAVPLTVEVNCGKNWVEAK